MQPGQVQRLAGEGAEIPILAYLGVVDEPMASAPAQKRLLLYRIRITAGTVAVHAHSGILAQTHQGTNVENAIRSSSHVVYSTRPL